MSKYERYETAPPAAWAWFFLRRNPDFRRRCDALPPEDHPERKHCELEIARDFSLRRFKHWKEGISSKEVQAKRPLFSPIAVWETRLEDEKPQALKKIALRQDQVLIRFDINSIIKDKKSLSIQLKDAHDRLLARAKQLKDLEQQSESVARRSRGTVQQRLQWLRLYDAEQAGIDRCEAYQAICPALSRDKRCQDIKRACANALEVATDYVENRYRAFAYEDAPTIAFTKPVPRKKNNLPSTSP